MDIRLWRLNHQPMTCSLIGWFKRILIQDSQQAYSLRVVLHIKVGTLCVQVHQVLRLEHRLGLMEILKKPKKKYFCLKNIFAASTFISSHPRWVQFLVM